MTQAEQLDRRVSEDVREPGRRAVWPVWPFVAALAAAPVLAMAGLAVEPPDAYGSERVMTEAYAAAPTRVDLQATGLHLGYVLFGFGMFGAAATVAGRGRRVALAGGFLSLLGFGFMSAFLLMDWVTIAAADEVGVSSTVAIMEAIGGYGFVAAWILPQMVGLVLGVPLVVVGLARAGLLPWWALAAPLTVVVPTGALVGDRWGPVIAVAVYGALGWAVARAVRRQ